MVCLSVRGAAASVPFVQIRGSGSGRRGCHQERQ